MELSFALSIPVLGRGFLSRLLLCLWQLTLVEDANAANIRPAN